MFVLYLAKYEQICILFCYIMFSTKYCHISAIVHDLLLTTLVHTCVLLDIYEHALFIIDCDKIKYSSYKMFVFGIFEPY